MYIYIYIYIYTYIYIFIKIVIENLEMFLYVNHKSIVRGSTKAH
jgi:hypothetical protein